MKGKRTIPGKAAQGTKARASSQGRFVAAVTRHDLTTVKRGEQAFRESQARYQALFENIREAVAVYEAVDGGKNFIIRDFNPAAEAIEKMPKEALLGRRVTEAFPGIEAFGILDVFRRVWATGSIESFPARVYKDARDPGTWRENWVYKLPSGEIVAVYRDITEQKRTEAALRESEDKFKYFFDHSVTGKSITLPTGEIQVNAALCAMLGYTADELRDLKWSDITHPDDIALTQEFVDSLLARERESARFRKRYLHKSGASVWTDISTSIRRDPEGRPLYFISTISNITDQVRAEEEVRRSLQEKETLLREVYHRTKNDMNVIGAMLSLQARAKGDETTAGIFREVEAKIRVMALVHQKLYESKDLSRIDLRDYISELTAQLVASHRDPGTALQASLDLASIQVPIDIAIPCGMILNELFSNAVKHAFPGTRTGQVRIRLARTDRDEIELDFADDGVGVPADFDFRTQRSLGLQTIFMLAEHQLQGSIRFESPEGGGLACWIRIPEKPDTAKGRL
ncbi:MAG: PAS domain S-box protein [Candidatus Aminicenantes bacterium]|nr:PAS domain S-box protein [Candidatus Aminicenantes bacterium]